MVWTHTGVLCGYPFVVVVVVQLEGGKNRLRHRSVMILMILSEQITKFEEKLKFNEAVLVHREVCTKPAV